MTQLGDAVIAATYISVDEGARRLRCAGFKTLIGYVEPGQAKFTTYVLNLEPNTLRVLNVNGGRIGDLDIGSNECTHYGQASKSPSVSESGVMIWVRQGHMHNR